jgi:glycine cleavage system regulatory protein/uncharacterized protein YceK
MKKLAPLFLSLLLLTGCGSIFERSVSYYGDEMPAYTESYSMAEDMSVGGAKMMDSSGSMMAPDLSVTDRKLIMTGNLSLHVADVRTTVTDISTATTGMNGMVISSNVTRGDKSYSAYMNVRVPADQFEAAMAAFKEEAIYVESEDSNSSDVTEYYMDLETRLKNKQAEEAQYLEILKKASTVTDTLAVTQALNDVQYEIESLQAQIQSYDNQIDYSNIYLSLSEDESAEATAETWSPTSTVHEAQSDFVALMQGVVDLVIYAVVLGWPVLVILVLVWLVKRSRKGGRK